MIYGLDRRLPAEPDHRPTEGAKAGFVGWRRLDEQSRLQLVERQLRPAQHRVGGYRAALGD